MKDSEIDALLKQAANSPPKVDSAMLNRISESMGLSPKAVRVLPSQAVLVGILFLSCGALAVAGGLILGPHGIQKMNRLEIATIFPLLALLMWLASMISVGEVIPGSRRLMAPWLLGFISSTGLIAVFALLFRDWAVSDFLVQGLKCLGAGLAQAIPAGIAFWITLRRGFAVDPGAAGFASGTLAGLVGAAMLEIHCPLFEAPHLMVWHVGVVVVGAFAGMWGGAAFRRRSATSG